MDTDQEERAAYITGLRALADALEAHPGIPLPLQGPDSYSPLLFGFYGSPEEARQAMAATARTLPCTWGKTVDEKWLNLNGKLGGLHIQLYAARDAVCTRRVVGTEEREVEEEVTPAVKRKVTKKVDVVEWECGPILRPAHQCAPGKCTCGASVSAAGKVTLPLDVSGDLDAIPANRIGEPAPLPGGAK